MMKIYAILLVLWTGILIFGALEEVKRPGLKNRTKGLRGFFLAFGRFAERKLGIIPWFHTEPEEEDKNAGKMALVWGAIFIALGFCLLSEIKAARESALTGLLRPAFGEQKSVELTVRGLSKEEDIRLEILSRDPSEEEVLEVFERVFPKIMEESLGDNESYERITGPLEPVDETEEGITCTFIPDDPEILSSYGWIMAGEVPSEGLETAVTVVLSYGNVRKEYRQKINIFPAEKNMTEREKLEALLQDANERDRETGRLVLPEKLEDKTLEYQVKKPAVWLVLGFALVLSAVLLRLPEEKRLEEKRKREEDLILAYPGLVSRLSVLIFANLSVRSAWARILQERKKAVPEGDPLFDEMRITMIQLNQGGSEAEIYAEFGRRCGPHAYQRLGTLLEQNLRQGISGFDSALKKELSQALTDKKNKAVSMGEKAGTRLLFPMLVMLVLILVILIVPALFSI